jgi:putative Mg2+ transporter-C (MgtC) family protein
VTSHGPGLVSLGDEAARLGAAVVAGALLGLNRNLRGKSAGLRTHALVALGAAAAVVAAAHAGDVGAASRVMQGVITGVGFLGAGVILHPRTGGAGAAPPAGGHAGPGARGRRREVRGLTTAASVWMAAMLGLAAGAGLWSLALLAAALTLAVLVGGGGVEDAVRRRVRDLARRRPRRP